MKFYKSFRMALNMVLHSRLRSWLTIIGVVIGVASVISIVGIGEGLSEQIQSNFKILSADIITISPGHSKSDSFGGPGGDRGPGGGASTASASTTKLTNQDVQALKGLNQVLLINTQISGSADIIYLAKKGSVSITGIDPKVYPQISTTTILQGRNLDGADLTSILIGSNLATKFFDKPILINQVLTIGGRSFKVVGIMDDNSNSVVMPIMSAYDILTTKTKFEYDQLQVKIKNADLLNDTQNKITAALYSSRHVDAKKQDFSIRTNSQANNTRQQMISTLTTFLTAIASVSLIVGAVGIANTMFTSVLEKTKEIGIMKAIGARNKDILTIFLVNAALIGLVGGLLGVLLGYGVAFVLSAVGMPEVIKVSSVLITISISIGVGLASGLIPALNASQLDPVEALRRD